VGFGLVADRDSTSSLQAAAATSAATSAAAPVLTPLSHSLIAPRLAPAPASLGSEQHIQDAGSRGPSFAMLLLVLAAAVLLYLFSMMMTAVACRARPQVRQSARGTCDKKVIIVWTELVAGLISASREKVAAGLSRRPAYNAVMPLEPHEAM